MSKYDDLNASVILTSKAIFTSMLQEGQPIQAVQMMANKLQHNILVALQTAGAEAMLSTDTSPMHQQIQPDQDNENPFL